MTTERQQIHLFDFRVMSINIQNEIVYDVRSSLFLVMIIRDR